MNQPTSAVPLNYPVKIVSDLHYRIMGGRLRRPEDLVPIFSGFKTIILNGDSVEQHLYGTSRANRHKEEMESAARNVGSKLIFLRGNHDPEIGSAKLRFAVGKRTVRVAHGDFGLIQLSLSPHHTLGDLSCICGIPSNFQILPGYWRQVRMALDSMQENEIFILGHTHQPSLTRSGSKVVVNLGAHMRGFANAWVEIEREHGEIVLCAKSRSIL